MKSKGIVANDPPVPPDRERGFRGRTSRAAPRSTWIGRSRTGFWPPVVRPLLFAGLTAGFAACLSASEPALSTQTNAAAAAPPVPSERAFADKDLLALLTSTLQQDYVKDRGELELRLTQPWKTRTVPDEPVTLKVLDMPTMGVTPTFIVRFEMHGEKAPLGTWQVAAQARVWRDVWIARSALRRGELISTADIARERRDVLALHEPLAEFESGDPTLELAEPLQAGSLLFARSVKLHPVIKRGQSADALVRDGTLSISMKVEALEDGAPGQTIRVRNAQSRRDVRGRVLNEQTILILL